jgi:hypothetical protein
MMMRINRLFFIFLFIAPVVGAQDSPFKLNVNVDLTEVHVNVTDDADRPVGNLKKENFRVFEDRSEQKITIFRHEDLPLSLGLVIDNSRSIEPRKERWTQPPCRSFAEAIRRTKPLLCILMTLPD